MNDNIKNLIQNNKFLYTMGRAIKNYNDPYLYDLIQGYYENTNMCQSFLIRHKGESYPDCLTYYISFGVNFFTSMGLCAILKGILDYLFVAEKVHLTPVVHIGNKCLYYDSGMDNSTPNVFEYYFMPVSEIPLDSISSCKNLTDAVRSHINLVMDKSLINEKNYSVTEKIINRLAYTYQKYIRLNKVTEEYISMWINKIIGNDKVLGIHIRGTDFNVGFKNHPIPIPINYYIKCAKEMMATGKYDKIFIATDDKNALMQFQDAFGSELCFYEDVLRGDGKVGTHAINSNRPHNNYLLGLEVIRDVYTLASCNGFIAGHSYVSYAARYVKKSMNKEFDDKIILDNGIYTEASKDAKRILKKKANHDFYKDH